MARKSEVYLHARTAELICTVEIWLTRDDCAVSRWDWDEKKEQSLDREMLNAACCEFSPLGFIRLMVSPPPGGQPITFEEKALFDIGLENAQKITSSLFSGSATGFQSQISDLKKLSRAGMIAINPRTGANVIERKRRFTQGALEAYRAGTALCDIADGIIFEPIV